MLLKYKPERLNSHYPKVYFLKYIKTTEEKQTLALDNESGFSKVKLSLILTLVLVLSPSQCHVSKVAVCLLDCRGQ